MCMDQCCGGYLSVRSKSKAYVFNFLVVFFILTLLIPTYLGPTLYTKMGGGGKGHLDPLLSHQHLNIKFCKVLEIPFKISEKTKACKKSFVWLRWQLFDKMMLFTNNCQNDYEKQLTFKCSQKPQVRRC